MSHHVVISDAKATDDSHTIEQEILSQYDVTTSTARTRTEDEVLEALAEHDADGLIVDAGVPVTERVLRESALTVVARAGIGVDNVDLRTAKEEEITVLNHPTYCLDEVATHALSLLLSGARGLPLYDRSTRGGDWDWRAAVPLHRLRDATLGILSFGEISRRLATMVQGFGCELLAHDPYVAPDVIRSHNVEPAAFDELCERSDLLSIHAPLTEETEEMVDADALDRLDDDAILVNVGRGPVVDTDALVTALEQDELGFAALDVTDPEPLPADHPLYDLDNATVTPHAAWYSEASKRQLAEEIAADVGRVLTSEAPENEVRAGETW
jgi:D-3-phosphoglycerate dehydrogenase